MTYFNGGKGPTQNKIPNKNTFPNKVFKIVRCIPRSKVLTYGQVATLAGVPRGARIVGGLLYQSGPTDKLPWQRVINAQGKISTYRVGMGEEQRRLLEQEGLVFNPEGAVDLKKYQWWPKPGQLKRFTVDEELAWRISQRIGF